eukprot:gene12426-4979_t
MVWGGGATAQGALLLSGTAQREALAAGAWHRVAVAFDWPRRCYDVYVGTRRCFQSVAFRDASASAAAALDIYPTPEGGRPR